MPGDWQLIQSNFLNWYLEEDANLAVIPETAFNLVVDERSRPAVTRITGE